MEKEQMEEMFIEGQFSYIRHITAGDDIVPVEKYYNETYKN